MSFLCHVLPVPSPAQRKAGYLTTPAFAFMRGFYTQWLFSCHVLPVRGPAQRKAGYLTTPAFASLRGIIIGRVPPRRRKHHAQYPGEDIFTSPGFLGIQRS